MKERERKGEREGEKEGRKKEGGREERAEGGEREREKEKEKERIPWKLQLPWTSVCVSVAGKRSRRPCTMLAGAQQLGVAVKGLKKIFLSFPSTTLHCTHYQGQSRPPMQVYLE